MVRAATKPAPSNGVFWNKLRQEHWLVQSLWLVMAVFEEWPISQGNGVSFWQRRSQHCVVLTKLIGAALGLFSLVK